MRSPIKIRKHLVRKAPIKLETVQYNTSIFTVKEITYSDINNDSWLSTKNKEFKRMLEKGHIGLIAMNENKECVAYGWVALGNVRPSHIPKIPENSAWLHYDRVRQDYRGHGLHRLLMQERVRLIREKHRYKHIYTDTSEDNIPSRVNQEKLNFNECGIYYTVEIGTRRLPFLHILFGKWNKDKEHPKIKKYIERRNLVEPKRKI